MTILGSHTIQEVEDLMKTIEYRIQQMNKANSNITQQQVDLDPLGMLDLQKDWTAFQVRWATMRDQVLSDLLMLSLAQPLVSISLIPAEKQYQKVISTINTGPNGSIAKGDLSDCANRIAQLGQVHIDFANMPVPSNFDPDLAAYKTVDAGIKKGEDAAKAAVGGAGDLNASVNNGILDLLSANIGKVAIGAALVLGGTYAYVKVTGAPVKALAEKL